MSELARLEGKFRRLAELRVDRDMTKKVHESAEKAYREYEAELYESVEDSALKGTVEFDFGGELGVIRFQPRATIYGRVIDKNAAYDSFENEAIIDEMTEPKFAARRLNEYVRDRLEAGLGLPEGVDYYVKRFFTVSFKG